MPTYRLYFMNSSSGHIEHYREFEAASDAEAMTAACSYEGGMPLELWSRHRKVGRIEAVRRAPPACTIAAAVTGPVMA